MSAVLNTRTPPDSARLRLHARRKRTNAVALTLALAAMAFGLFWLIWILIETVRLGIGGMALSLFTEMTPPPQAETGGLANAIFGSLAMVSLATLLGRFNRSLQHLKRGDVQWDDPRDGQPNGQGERRCSHRAARKSINGLPSRHSGNASRRAYRARMRHEPVGFLSR